MRLSKLIVSLLTAGLSAGLGFTTYKEIREGADNSPAVAYQPLDRSNALFLYIQIVAGGDHTGLIDDFNALARNYGEHGVQLIPRVRYGNPDGSVAAEPNDSAVLIADVKAWAAVFAAAADIIQIPVVQAGFLGLWGEWHDGPFCQAQGTDESSENLNIKRQVIEALQASGIKVALRYPRDHQALFPGDRAVTLHNDCIFNGGPDGHDGGTFPVGDRQTWVDYTRQVAGGNTFGGEGCNQAGDSTYDWTNWTDLCGDNGLVPYIEQFQIAYLNPGNPEPLQELFNHADWTECVDAIQSALQQYA